MNKRSARRYGRDCDVLNVSVNIAHRTQAPPTVALSVAPFSGNRRARDPIDLRTPKGWNRSGIGEYDLHPRMKLLGIRAGSTIYCHKVTDDGK